MLKLSLQQNLEADKERYFKGQTGGGTQAQIDKLKSKNKRRKEKQREKDGELEEETQEQAEEQGDETARKKRNRLALYGVKQ